jgi:hypothetical protein
MRMHVSMLVRRSAALLVVLAAASACSDAPSAPHAASQPPYDVAALQPLASRNDVGRGLGNPNTAAADSDNVLDITVDPNVSRTYAFGQNWIYFPARSICDPATSGYGIGLWDTPCTPLNSPLTVTVHWSSKGGHAYARFSPELRFVPAPEWNVGRWVILSLHDQRRLHDLDSYSILYDAGPGIGWIDESATDPTLHAWINYLTNSVSRRIKHFSGYMLAAGYTSGSIVGGLSDASY